MTVLTLNDIVAEPRQADMLTPETARELWQQILIAIMAVQPHLYSAAVESFQPDHLLDIREAAKRLGMSTTTLYRKAGDYPFTLQNGKHSALKFSERGIERWMGRK